MTDKIKNQKGITLIALIVTIIVLIILAAVGISMLLGDNGITEKARWSAAVTEFERVEEQNKLYLTEWEINKYGKVPERIQKFSFQSLFTNISYASDSTKPLDTIYPVIKSGEGYVDIKNEDTLKRTIKTLEGVNPENKKKVQLYKVDLELLGETKVKREYVINIKSGNLYWLNKVSYQGLDWHTPKGGVKRDVTYQIFYSLGNGENEPPQDIPNGSPEITLKTGNEIVNKPEGKLLAHWKYVPDPNEEDDDEDEEEEGTTGNDESSTEDTTVKTYKGGETIKLEKEGLKNKDIYLEAVWQEGVILNPNGGTIEGQEPNETKTIGVIKGKEYGEELEAPTREGYIFKGWFTEQEEGKGTEKKSSDQYDASELTNSTLYAQWEEIKFSVTVTDVTNTSWKQDVSVTSGNLTGYNTTYYISEQGTDDENASTQTTTTASGKTDSGTYYVWAIAKKGEFEIKSDNYMVVKMGHKHEGTLQSGSTCYIAPRYKFVYSNPSPSFRDVTSSTNTRFCVCCGTQVGPTKTYGSYRTTGTNNTSEYGGKRCVVCNVSGWSTPHDGSGWMLCDWCYSTCWLGNGSSHASDHGSVNKDVIRWTYSLVCTIQRNI